MKVKLPSNFKGNGNHLQEISKQAKLMQDKMQKKLEEFKIKTFESTSGGGSIKVTFCGDLKLKKIFIDSKVIDLNDLDMIEDMIVAAVNEGISKVEIEKNKILSGVSSQISNSGLDSFF